MKSTWKLAALACSAFLGAVQAGEALAQNTFPDSGKVGIGTLTPARPLEIKFGSQSVPNMLLKMNAGFTNIGTGEFVEYGLGPQVGVSKEGPFGVPWFQVRDASGVPRLSVGAGGIMDGFVGIGTTIPVAQLHVVGGPTFSIQSLVPPFKNWSNLAKSVALNDRSFVEFSSPSTKYYLGASDDDGGNLFLYTVPVAGGSQEARMVVHKDGNVGIGTYAPTSKLEVNGTVKAREVKVTLNGWPDFVFAPDYPLPSLCDLEQSIREEGRLPGVPSAAEVSENGVALGRMQAVLLQKVEELTLHVIDLKKENDALKGRLAILERK